MPKLHKIPTKTLDSQKYETSDVLINTKIKDSVPLMRVKRSDIRRKLEQVKRVVEGRGRGDHPLPYPLQTTTRLPTSLDNEIWEVKALDIDIKMTSQPSKALDKLVESRKQRHQQAETDLFNDLEAINKEAEDVILKLAGPLKDELQALSDAAGRLYEGVRDKTSIPYKLAQLGKTEIQETYSAIEALYSKRKEHLDRYGQSLMENEETRAKNSKLVFRKYANLFNQIAHQLPYENQEYFEHEILKYNQVVLNNIRNYGDIHKQLILVGDEELQRYRKKLNNIEYQRRDHKRADARALLEKTSVLSLLADTQARFEKDLEVQQIRERITGPRAEGLFQGLISHWMAQGNNPFTSVNVDEWSDQLARTVMHLDSCTQQILQLYTNALSEVINRIKAELGLSKMTLRDDELYNTRYIEDLHELVTPIFEKVMKMHNEDIGHLENTWKMVMTKMKSSIAKTEVFLKEAALIWEHHFQRLEQCLKIVNEGLKTNTDFDSSGLNEKEIRLNIAIDNLRQETTEAKLEKGLANVKDLLDEIANEHVACYEKQLATIKNYPDLVEAELEVLSNEVLVFTERYPREDILSTVNSFMEIRRFRGSMETTPSRIMGREMTLCDYQLTAVGNWKHGLWESMQHYAATCKEDVMSKASAWVNTKSVSLFHILEGKLLMHSPRYNRIKQEIHNVRLTELNSHRYRLNSHKKGIKLHIKEITKDLTELTTNEEQLKEEFETKIKEAAEYGRSALRSANIALTITKVDEMLQTYIRDVKNVIWEFQEESDSKMSWLRESNVDFMKAITLFSEGGNFSAKEADEYISTLSDIDAYVDEQEGANMKQIDNQEITLIKDAHNAVKKFKDEMKPLRSELLFGELVIGMIKAVQSLIKKEVVRIKCDGKLLYQHVDQMNEVLTGHCEPWTMHDILDRVLEQCMARKRYLLQPQVIVGETVTEEAGLKFSSFEIEQTKKENLSKVSKATDRFLDYREILFGSKAPPPDEDMFLSRVCLNMWRTFGQIQETACDFYTAKGNKRVAKPNVIQPVYDDFIEELLIKFKYYHVQCEEVWLDQAQEYVALITKLKEMVNDCVKKSLSKFQTDQLEGIHQLQLNNLVQAETSVVQEWEGRLGLENKLLPLHGYPGNKKLLEDLNNLVYQTSQDLQEQVYKQFQDITESYKELHPTYQPKLGEMVKPLRLLVDKVFEPRLTATLVEQIEEVYISVLDRADKNRKEMEAIDVPALPSIITTATDVNRWKDSLMMKRMHRIVNSPIVEEGQRLVAQATSEVDAGVVPKQHILSIEHDAYYAKSILTRLEILRKETVRVTRVASERSDMNITETREGEEEGETGATLKEINKEDEAEPAEMLEEELYVPSVEIDEMVDSLVKEFNDKYEAGLTAISNKQEAHAAKTLHQKFIERWETNVKKVKELYACRYEEYEANRRSQKKELELLESSVMTATTAEGEIPPS